jgi:hypothetical protein
MIDPVVDVLLQHPAALLLLGMLAYASLLLSALVLIAGMDNSEESVLCKSWSFWALQRPPRDFSVDRGI